MSLGWHSFDSIEGRLMRALSAAEMGDAMIRSVVLKEVKLSNQRFSIPEVPDPASRRLDKNTILIERRLFVPTGRGKEKKGALETNAAAS